MSFEGDKTRRTALQKKQEENSNMSIRSEQNSLHCTENISYEN